MARFVKLKGEKATAEIGITVNDTYQKQGIGKILFILMNIIASQNGIQTLRYHILSENRSVLNYLDHFEILKQVYDGPLTLLETKVIGSHSELKPAPEMATFIEKMKMIEEALDLLNEGQHGGDFLAK